MICILTHPDAVHAEKNNIYARHTQSLKSCPSPKFGLHFKLHIHGKKEKGSSAQKPNELTSFFDTDTLIGPTKI